MREGPALLISLTIQVLLASLLGHYYDMRVFMAAGYAVSSGLNPYEQHNLNSVFHHPIFQEAVPGIGYPPPWPLLMGLTYLISFNLVPNLLLYSFAVRIPVIIGNVGLAYFVKRLLTNMEIDSKKAYRAWLFILFNPLLLCTTVAWGQFDTVIALLSLASLYLLYVRRDRESAILLSLAVSMKPIALPLIPLPIIYLAKSPRQALQYLLIFTPTLLLFSVAPFFLLGWSPQPILSNWNAHFSMYGGMSLFSFIELLEESYKIPGGLELLGFLWVPALAIGYYALKPIRTRSLEEMIQTATGLILIFFLTRAWLSEPNINLILPLMLTSATMGEMSWRSLHLMWIIPLTFTLLNASLPYPFLLVYPSALVSIAELDQHIRGVRLAARALMVVPWQVLGWRIVTLCRRFLSLSH